MTSCIIQLNDRLLIGTTDKPILDYKKSNYLVLRDMKKDRNSNIYSFHPQNPSSTKKDNIAII